MAIYVEEVRRLQEQAPAWKDGEHRERHSVSTSQGEGLAVEVRCPSGVVFTIDEPADFGGGGLGPNPAEAALGGIAASLGVTVRVHAGLLGIAVDRIETRVSGDLDLRGFLDSDSAHRAGFESISIELELVLGAGPMPSAEAIGVLARAAERCCPVLDSFRQPPSISFAVSS